MYAIYSDKRKSGISLIGDLSWGTHICQFYQTKEDLLEILVPYFRAGLENNEFCVWIASKPLSTSDVKKALEKALPHFDQYQEKEQIEIIPRGRWYARGGEAIVSTLDHAILSGFDGIRLTCNAFREKKSGKVSVSSEETDAISRYNVIALFAYPREEFDAIGLMEVVKNHRFALVRNAGRWEVIESSEARVAKDALRRSEEKFQSLFSNMAEGFAYHRIVLDGRGKPCDYVFLEVNHSFERLTGLKREDIIGKRVTEVLPGIEKDSADWIGKYGNVTLTGKPVRFESYAEPLKRWYSISSFSPHKGYFAVTFSDITARKKAEEALRESEERWATTLASIGDAVISTDVEGRITFINAVAETLTGWRFAEASARPVTEVFNVINEETRREIENPVTRVLQEGGIIGLANHTVLIRKDGTEVPIDDSGAPIRDRNGKTVGVVLVFRDITGRKQMESNQILLTDILQIFNRGGDLHPVIGETLRLIRKASGCDAVGLRLRQGEDCPYFESNGLSEEFLREENFLCAKGGEGAIARDAEGRAVLECTCGLVLSGRTDPTMSCFTRGGSFWTNASSALLALPPEADPRTNPRNRCIHSGYESVGLFPIRSGQETIGLLQLNGRQAGRFTRGKVAFYEALAQNIGLALQRVTADEALRKSEGRHRSYIEVTEQLGWTTNGHGEVVEDIPAWRKFTGQSEEGVKDWGWSNALHPDDFEPAARAWRDAVATKRNYETEYRIRRHDGVYRNFLARGVPVLKANGDVLEWVGTCIDITERKRMEEELRKSRDQLEIKVQERTAELEEQSRILEGFFKSTITPLVFLDRNFNFIRVNEAYAKCCQRDISEFQGHNHFEFYPHEENEAIFRRVVETKVPYQAIAKPFTFPDHPEWGTTYWDWTLTPLLDAKGEVEFLVFSLEDVTKRNRAEEELQKAHDQVRFFASQCLTAQETERKRIAGELHDSVAASIGAMRFRIYKIAEEMKQGNGSPDSLQDLGSKVMEINNEVRRIMADLRPSVLDDLGIIPAIEWFCREYQKIYSHISVEKQVGVPEHEVPDSLKTPIFRISQEALNNIAKHSKATRVNLRLQKANSGIELIIQDNGQGFELDTAKRGLGLSTMKERAQLSGGICNIESVKGAGTTIRCTWPLT